MTYTPATGAIRDKLRFLLGDTGALTSSVEIFTDDELDMVLNEADQGLYDAASLAYLSLAALHARHAIAWKVLAGDLEIDKTKIASEFRMLAEAMTERSAISGGIGGAVVWTDANVTQFLDGGLSYAGFYDYQRTIG